MTDSDRDSFSALRRAWHSATLRRLGALLATIATASVAAMGTAWQWSQGLATRDYVDAKMASAAGAHASFDERLRLLEAYRQSSKRAIEDQDDGLEVALRWLVRFTAAEGEPRAARRKLAADRAADRFDRLVLQGQDVREAARRAVETSPY